MMNRKLLGFAALAAATVGSPAAAINVYGINLTGQLVTFDSAAPTVLTSTTAISGVSGLSLVGIDFRPATGGLYGLASNGTLYTINTATGAATGLAPSAISLNGNNFGFDFNPTADRIRVVSNSDQNLRLNPDTGTLAASDTPLAFAAGDPNFGANPNVVAAAYTNNFAGAATTTLYGLDSALNTLVVINPPNNGVLSTFGAFGLGIDIGDDTSFDIFSSGAGMNQGFFSTGLGFYSINFASGSGTLIGATGGLRSIAIGPAPTAVPEPESWALLVIGMSVIGFSVRRKRQQVSAAV